MKRIIKGILILVIIALLGVIFLYGSATNSSKIVALSDSEEYLVYDGKNVYEYYRTTLSKEQQIAYDEVKEAYLQFKQEYTTQARGLTKEDFKQVYKALTFDHPEIFWIKSYGVHVFPNGKINTLKKIYLRYYYDVQEAQEVKKRIGPKYEKIITEAKKLSTEEEKIRYVHDKLIIMGTYNDKYTEEQKGEYQSIVSIFDTGDTVCAGYSYGFKFIMDRLGINAISVVDIEDDDNDNHVWNRVKIGDEWYNLDITWDDTNNVLSSNYFLKSDATFYLDHKDPGNLPVER